MRQQWRLESHESRLRNEALKRKADMVRTKRDKPSSNKNKSLISSRGNDVQKFSPFLQKFQPPKITKLERLLLGGFLAISVSFLDSRSYGKG